MKKRTGGVILAMMLSFSLFGCGNSAEPKQEETPQVTQEEESTEVAQTDNEEPVIIEEQEDLYIYDCIYESDKKFLDVDDFNPNDDTPYHITDSLDLYLDTGALGGMSKPDIEVPYVRRNGDGWVFITFKQTSFFAKEDEFDRISEKVSVEKSDEYSQQGPLVEEEVPAEDGFVAYDYDEVLKTVGFDKNKEYTRDEYIEILTKVCEEMGKTYNKEMEIMNPYDDYDGFHLECMFGITEYTEETVKIIMNRVEYGRDGYGGITEFCIMKAEKDGVEGINMVVKVDHEVVQKNMDEWQ